MALAEHIRGVAPGGRGDAIERFARKVERTADGHWLWKGHRDSRGYGRFRVGARGGPGYAHRAAYELFVGDIPTGYHVDHLCFTPSCVNPRHLEAVTPAENYRRSRARRAAA